MDFRRFHNCFGVRGKKSLPFSKSGKKNNFTTNQPPPEHSNWDKPSSENKGPPLSQRAAAGNQNQSTSERQHKEKEFSLISVDVLTAAYVLQMPKYNTIQYKT